MRTDFTDKQNPARGFKIVPEKTTFMGDASVDVEAIALSDGQEGY